MARLSVVGRKVLLVRLSSLWIGRLISEQSRGQTTFKTPVASSTRIYLVVLVEGSLSKLVDVHLGVERLSIAG